MTNILPLDSRELHFLVPGPREGMRLFLRLLSPRQLPSGPPRIVLYVHGATFPSALSVAHRFDGRSWRDELTDAGFDVWGLDFYGFGGSDRYPEMNAPPESTQPLGNAEDAAEQMLAAVQFVLAHHAAPRLSMIAHSWGSMPACRFAGDHPALVDRLVLFGAIARRKPSGHEPAPVMPAWRVVSTEDQRKRFIEDVPPEGPQVLSQAHFDDWAQRYLDSDTQSRTRVPNGVKIPAGPAYDILRAWHGHLAYDPEFVQAPVALIRGEWDGLCTDQDARWLFDAFRRSPLKRDVKISGGTHLMHLEYMRYALYREAIAFLLAGDTPTRGCSPSPLPHSAN